MQRIIENIAMMFSPKPRENADPATVPTAITNERDLAFESDVEVYDYKADLLEISDKIATQNIHYADFLDLLFDQLPLLAEAHEWPSGMLSKFQSMLISLWDFGYEDEEEDGIEVETGGNAEDIVIAPTPKFKDYASALKNGGENKVENENGDEEEKEVAFAPDSEHQASPPDGPPRDQHTTSEHEARTANDEADIKITMEPILETRLPIRSLLWHKTLLPHKNTKHHLASQILKILWPLWKA